MALKLAEKPLGRQLDRVEALELGGGFFDARAIVRGNAAGGLVGAGAELGWRAKPWLSLIAGAEVGYGFGNMSGLQYGAHVAARGTW